MRMEEAGEIKKMEKRTQGRGWSSFLYPSPVLSLSYDANVTCIETDDWSQNAGAACGQSLEASTNGGLNP
jgi:hypothetical protein